MGLRCKSRAVQSGLALFFYSFRNREAAKKQQRSSRAFLMAPYCYCLNAVGEV